MNAYQIATTTMHNGLNTFLDKNAAIYANDNAFLKGVTTFKNKLAIQSNYRPQLATNTEAYSHIKRELKQVLADSIARFSGLGYVGLKQAALNLEAAKLTTAFSEYYYCADAALEDLAQANREVLNNNLAVLSPDYVTAADIAAVDAAILQFSKAKGSSESVYKDSPSLRSGFRGAIAETNDAIADLRFLGLRYKLSNEDFYNSLIHESTVIRVNTHHTSLKVVVLNANDGSKVMNAIASLNKSKKTGNSDNDGLIEIDEIANGKTILTIKASGYKELVQTIYIERGRTNQVEVKLEKAA